MKLLTKLLILVILVGAGLSAGALILNKVPISDPPGWKTRLFIYMSNNSAQTAEDSVLPELRPELYPVTEQQLFDLARDAVVKLGWHINSIDSTQRRLQVVITSPLLRFKDDMTIQALSGPDANHSVLQARSQSRIGRADFGANLSHILAVKHQLKEAIPSG